MWNTFEIPLEKVFQVERRKIMDGQYIKTRNLLVIVILVTLGLNFFGMHLEIPFALRVILAAIVGAVIWISLRITWFK